MVFRFEHGLGDLVNLLRVLELYRDRGRLEQIGVATTPDKRALLELAGVRPAELSAAADVHSWAYPADGVHCGPEQHWRGHKVAGNISRYPLPDIGPPAELWHALQVPLRVRPSAAAAERAADQTAGLPRPLVLFHPMGNTDQRRKSLPAAVQREFLLRWVDATDGSVVVLDWDQRAETLRHPRVRSLDSLGGAGLVNLLALMWAADLVIGCDSGPLHLAGLTYTPALGLWSPGHHPARYLLPGRNCLNLVPADGEWRELNQAKRAAWRIIDVPGAEHVPAAEIVRWAVRLLAPRWCAGASAADDAMLGWVLSDLLRAHVKPGEVGGAADRGRSFAAALDELRRRRPDGGAEIVETGTIRSVDDWGAGWSTWLFGVFSRITGGRVTSIDLDGGHCDFAARWTADFGSACRVVEGDGADVIGREGGAIDLLYLDSCDTEHPEHAAVCLAELRAALPRLSEQALVLLDDSPPAAGGGVAGKGAAAVPFLRERGWRVLYQGYQVLLDRGGRVVLPRRPAAMRAGEPRDGRPVVYTVLFGDRDVLRPPTDCLRAAGVDLVCLTDRERDCDGWRQVVVAPSFRSRLESRWWKWLPHVAFPLAPWSVYLDATMDLVADPAGLLTDRAGRSDLALFGHPARSSLYAEAAELVRLGMVDRVAAERQVADYRSAGVPDAAGLMACGLLWRRHSAALVRVCEDVWRDLALYGPRDQVVLPAVCWRYGFEPELLSGGLHAVDWLHVHPHHEAG